MFGGCVDGWMDVWMDERMDECMDGGWMYVWMSGWMGVQSWMSVDASNEIRIDGYVYVCM